MRAETRRGDHRGTRRLLTHLYGGLPCPARCTLAGEAVAVAPSGRLYPCAQMIAEDTDDTLVIGTVDAGLDAVFKAPPGSRDNYVGKRCALDLPADFLARPGPTPTEGSVRHESGAFPVK